MAGVAHKPQHEFWQRPAAESVGVDPQQSPVRPAPHEICAACAAEYLAGASFCHQCGLPRDETSTETPSLPGTYIYQQMRLGLGLSAPAMVAFLVGIGCVGIAIIGGATYSSQAYPDFPAIMLWRTQWLVGATAAFVAGLLLKHPSPPK
jgi:hypothetical protein